MRFVLKLILILIFINLIGGCSKLQFPWVYRIFVQQGNFIESDMIEQLEVGMTPEQVRYIMGSPMIADTFHPDRWDYYFTLRRGDKQYNEYHFTVLFENGKLASWEGDYDKAEVKGASAAKLNEEVREEIEDKKKSKDFKQGGDAIPESNEPNDRDGADSATEEDMSDAA